jgi:hypothetical protein
MELDGQWMENLEALWSLKSQMAIPKNGSTDYSSKIKEEALKRTK